MISETTIYLYMYTLLMCDHIFETKLNTCISILWHLIHEIKLLLLTVDVLFQELVNSSRETSPLNL